MVKVKNTLSRERVICLMVVVFILNFGPPIYAVLEADRMPTDVEALRALVVGIMQVATLAYALLERGESKPSAPSG